MDSLIIIVVCFLASLVLMWRCARPRGAPDPWHSIQRHQRCMTALAPHHLEPQGHANSPTAGRASQPPLALGMLTAPPASGVSESRAPDRSGNGRSQLWDWMLKPSAPGEDEGLIGSVLPATAATRPTVPE
jgi:hypothetical protein